MRKVSLFIILIILAVDLSSFAGTICTGDDDMSPPKLRKPRTTEGLIIEGGASFPSLWGVYLLVPVESGGSVGIASQGTYKGYAPSDAAPSNVTTFDFILAYGYPRWSSILKGSGAGAFIGCGTTDRSYANMPWHLGLYGNLAVTFIRSGVLSFGMFLRPQVSFLITSHDKHGAMGQAANDTEYQLIYGGRVAFSFK